MNEDLSHGVAVDVDVLDLLGSDVLALSQLKDVLLPVDDLQRAVLRHTEDMLKEVFLHARKRLNFKSNEHVNRIHQSHMRSNMTELCI